jgi:hypothetical protein
VTDGGRVLCVSALGDGLDEARARAYEAVDTIRWQGKFCRRDIGVREVARRELTGGPDGAADAERDGERGDARDPHGEGGRGSSAAAGRGTPS